MTAEFIGAWYGTEHQVHTIACDKGWWDEDRADGEIIALIHSEVSEALEAMRAGNPRSEKLGDSFSSVEEELADVVIRIMDYAGQVGLRIPDAIAAKVEFNRTRERKHGKVF